MDDGASGKCDGGFLKLTIPYDVANSKVLQLKAGSCNTADTDKYSFSQTADAAHLSISVEDCHLNANTYDTPLARSLNYYSGKAAIVLGREDDDGNWYRFYDSVLRTECGIKTDYEASYGYGEISQSTHDSSLLPGTYQEMSFVITGYEDDAYTQEIADPASRNNRAGTMSYLSVHPKNNDDFGYDVYQYAVKSCTLHSDDDSVDSIDIFNYETHCENEFIDLEMSYVNNVFRLQHKMFVMMGTDAASYKVTCSIKLCENDDTDSVCRDVYTKCNHNAMIH
jgi:hypothetical protein